MEYLSDILRAAGALQLILLAVMYLNLGKPGLYASFFCFTLICYLVADPILRTPDIRWAQLLILFGAFAVSFAFWVLAKVIFVDSFRPGPAYLIFFLGMEAISYTSFLLPTRSIPSLILPVWRLFPQAIYVGLIVLTFIQVQARASEDLIEERRRFRRIFLMILGIYMMLVLSAEIAWKGIAPPRILDFVNVFLVVSMIFFFSFRLLQLRPRLFLEAPSAAPLGADIQLASKIKTLMETQNIHREEDLSVATIAGLLGEQEYKVRRAINGAMNYRNFYDFVNDFRIREACEMLSDPAKDSVPVLRIAMDCGYASLAPFNRAFKTLKGASPTDYRKAARTT